MVAPHIRMKMLDAGIDKMAPSKVSVKSKLRHVEIGPCMKHTQKYAC